MALELFSKNDFFVKNSLFFIFDVFFRRYFDSKMLIYYKIVNFCVKWSFLEDHNNYKIFDNSAIIFGIRHELWFKTDENSIFEWFQYLEVSRVLVECLILEFFLEPSWGLKRFTLLLLRIYSLLFNIFHFFRLTNYFFYSGWVKTTLCQLHRYFKLSDALIKFTWIQFSKNKGKDLGSKTIGTINCCRKSEKI